MLDAKIKAKELVNKSDIGDFEIYFVRHNLILFIGESYFFNNGAQLYLIFQPLYYTLGLSSSQKIVAWKSKGSSTEKIVTPTTADNNLSPRVEWY